MAAAQALEPLDLHIPPSERRGHRPCFVDGRMSTKTYLVLAARAESDGLQYNAIGIRKVDDGTYRTHAYPDFKFFGVPELREYRRAEYGYDGAYLSRKQVERLLLQLSQQRGVVVADTEKVFPVSDRGYDPNNDAV